MAIARTQLGIDAALRAKRIRDATLLARKSFLAYNKVAELEILALYEEAANTVVRRITYGHRAGAIVRARRVALLAEVDKEIARLRKRLGVKLTAQMRTSLDLGLKTGIKSMEAALSAARASRKNIQIGSSFIGIDGKVRRFNAATEIYAASQWAKVNQEAMDFLFLYRPTGNTFAQSIWMATESAQTTIKNMVNEAVLLGDSSQRLATSLQRYVTKQGMRTSPGRYKSAYANAWRLARTEMNRAYTEGQLKFAQTKSWIDGVIWRRGGDGDCGSGVCPDNANRFYPKGSAPGLPAHPNCMCYFEDHITEDPMPEGVETGVVPPARPIPIPPKGK